MCECMPMPNHISSSVKDRRAAVDYTLERSSSKTMLPSYRDVTFGARPCGSRCGPLERSVTAGGLVAMYVSDSRCRWCLAKTYWLSSSNHAWTFWGRKKVSPVTGWPCWVTESLSGRSTCISVEPFLPMAIVSKDEPVRQHELSM